MAQKIVVLGLGNLLLGDEGAGVRVIELLRRQGTPAGVDLIDGGTMGFALLGIFDRADLVVVIDAVRDGRPPGTVAQVTPAFDPACPAAILPHDVGLKNLLDAAALLGKRPEVVLFTISVQEADRLSLDLSPPVAGGVREAALRVSDLLKAAQD